MSGLFDMEKSAVKRALMAERQLMAASAGVALGGFILLGLLTNKVDRLQKLVFLLPVNVAAWSLTAACASQRKKEGFYKAMDTAQELQLKTHLQGMEAFYSATGKMQRQNNVVKWILQNTPQWQWARREHEFGLQGLFPRMEQPAIAPHSLENGLTIPTPAISSISPAEVERVTRPPMSAQLVGLAEAAPEYVRLDPHWIDELCDAASNPNMSKRFNHHFYLSGETQSGKSTLAGVIVNKIAARSSAPAKVIGSDPKDGVTNWLCQFSYRFDGWSALNDWVDFAFDQAEQQKNAYAQSPDVGEIFFLQDEVDSAFNDGKGYLGFRGAVKKVQAEQAARLQSLWNFLVKYMAGCKGHFIGLGQSPLSGDTGLSRPAYKSVCFIAMGSTANYIFDHPQDFLNVNKDVMEDLKMAYELMVKDGQRCALVIPMRGNPYVALIPQFDIPGKRWSQSEPSLASLSTESTPNHSLENPQEQDIQLSDQWYQDLQFWAISLVREPSPQELAQKFYELTQYELTSEGLGELLGEVQQWRRGVKE